MDSIVNYNTRIKERLATERRAKLGEKLLSCECFGMIFRYTGDDYGPELVLRRFELLQKAARALGFNITGASGVSPEGLLLLNFENMG